MSEAKQETVVAQPFMWRFFCPECNFGHMFVHAQNLNSETQCIRCGHLFYVTAQRDDLLATCKARVRAWDKGCDEREWITDTLEQFRALTEKGASE